jgi:uncharacterized protein
MAQGKADVTMNQMQKSLTGFGATLLGLWAVGTAGVSYYAYQQHIPVQVWIPALLALLIESSLYLSTGVAVIRTRLGRLGGKLPFLLVATAVVPYLVFSLGVGNFRLQSLGTVVVLAAVAAFWYRLMPRGPVTDLLFLVLMGGVFLTRVFGEIYINPAGKPALDIIGRMMWMRIGMVGILVMRKAEAVDFGFVPRAKDWGIGALFYLCAIPVIMPLALWIGFVQWRMPHLGPRLALTALGTFLGFLLVVGLAEELFFRGLLQPQLEKLTGRFALALVLTSVVFGSVHLPYRTFPNWKFALLATVAGVFYGLAYAKAKSVRASTVTHALMVTTWRVFFQGV